MPENKSNKRPSLSTLDRRSFLAASAIAAGSLLLRPAGASTRDWSGRTPVRYPDPDVIQLDPRFGRYKLGNAAIERLHTGSRWVEGPAWNGVGRYLIWSDIPSNIQLRWLEDDARVSVFRKPAGNSNGNTFDNEGRQISFEHGNRRVVRYEYDGTTTVLASEWQGKPLNAPNDGVVHPDGSVWFTDPGYGSMSAYEGARRPLEDVLPRRVDALCVQAGEEPRTEVVGVETLIGAAVGHGVGAVRLGRGPRHRGRERR